VFSSCNHFYAKHKISPLKILVLLILMHLPSGKISRINHSCSPWDLKISVTFEECKLCIS
jgi:hypothetical protein